MREMDSVKQIEIQGGEPELQRPLVIESEEHFKELILRLSGDLLKNARISLEPQLPSALAKLIKHKLLNNEQLRAINQAIAENWQKIGWWTVLHFALKSHNPQFLESVFTLLEPKERLSLVKEKDAFLYTALHYAAYHPEFLSIILAVYPEEERIPALEEKTKYQDTVLHLGACDAESLQLQLALYKKDKAIKVMDFKNLQDETLLHKAFNAKSLQIISDVYNEPIAFKAAIKAKNKMGVPVIQTLINDPDALEIALQLFPEPTELLTLLKDLDKLGRPLMHELTKNPVSLQKILERLPMPLRISALQIKNKKNQTLLDLINTDTNAKQVVFTVLNLFKLCDICENFVSGEEASTEEQQVSVATRLINYINGADLKPSFKQEELDMLGMEIKNWESNNFKIKELFLSIKPRANFRLNPFFNELFHVEQGNTSSIARDDMNLS